MTTSLGSRIAIADHWGSCDHGETKGSTPGSCWDAGVKPCRGLFGCALGRGFGFGPSTADLSISSLEI